MIVYLLPAISGIIGWIISYILVKKLQHPTEGIVAKNQQQLAQKLGAWVSTELVNFSDITGKLKDPAQLEAVHPLIETHLDNFLKVKLQERLPVISMFVSEAMLEQVKEGMIEEIKLLLPEVIGKYADSLADKMDLGKVVTNKLSTLPTPQLQEMVNKALQKQFARLQVMGLSIGLIIGFVNMALVLGVHI